MIKEHTKTENEVLVEEEDQLKEESSDINQADAKQIEKLDKLS